MREDAIRMLLASNGADWSVVDGLIDGGTLAVGAAADVTIIDPEAHWTIDPSRFASRGRNCPFAGREVRGRVVQTLVGGRIVYEFRP